MDTEEPQDENQGGPRVPADWGAPPPKPQAAILIGATWWERPARRNGLVKLKGGRRRPRRVVVIGYQLRRRSRQLLEQMQREGRSWTGWTVRYGELRKGASKLGAGGAIRYLEEEEFRARYRPAQFRVLDTLIHS